MILVYYKSRIIFWLQDVPHNFLFDYNKQHSSFVLSFVSSSDPGSSDESTDGSLSDYESSDDLSSEGEHEEDDLYQPLSFRSVNIQSVKTDTSCTYSRD